MNLEEFHKNWVPKECLPKELGGDLPTINEMHNSFRLEIVGLAAYYRAEEEQRKRATDSNAKGKKTIQEPTHQFSKLDID